MEKRQHQRMSVAGLQADISDGIGFYAGTVGDISRKGIHLVDLPARIDDTVTKMTVVVVGKNRNFKMLLEPKWASLQDKRKSVGFEIINTLWGWTEFVAELEPQMEKDIWENSAVTT